jgi:hypothetical protein
MLSHNIFKEREMNMQMKNYAVTESLAPAFNARGVLADPHPDVTCDPVSISVDAQGMILTCSKTGERFFGYRRSDLVMHHVSTLFSELTEIELIQKEEFNQSLVFLCRCGKIFQAKNSLGDTISCNLSFVHLDNNGENTFRLIASPADNPRAQHTYAFQY